MNDIIEAASVGSLFFILDGKTPVALTGDNAVIEWGDWMRTHSCAVAQDILCDRIKVSTVFLGIDHSWFGGDPLIFETMLFDKDDNSVMVGRCSTWDDAEVMHRQGMKMAEEFIERVVE